MDSATLAAVVAALAAVISALLAARSASASKRVDREIEAKKLWVTAYEKTLLEARLPDYKALWALTEPTSRRHIECLDEGRADLLMDELTRWYYQQGGLLLTSNSRNAFFHARESLAYFKRDRKQLGRIVAAFSELRTALCEDLNSRAGPSLVGGEHRHVDEEVPEVLFSRG
jgi:hypothetical protein